MKAQTVVSRLRLAVCLPAASAAVFFGALACTPQPLGGGGSSNAGDCGDGVCGSGESVVSCPADCEDTQDLCAEIDEPCASTSDCCDGLICGANETCQEESSGECLQQGEECSVHADCCAGLSCAPDRTCQGEPNDDVVIPSTTKILAPADLDVLESVSDDLSEIVFGDETEALAQVGSNDVLVCGIYDPMLPYGMLRRVTSIDRSGGKVTLATEQAALTDAIQQGSFSREFTLTGDGAVMRRVADKDSAAGGVRLAEAEGVVMAFNDVGLYDADGDDATRSDRIWLDGSMSFTPTIRIDVDILDFAFNTMEFEIDSDLHGSLSVTASREGTFDRTEKLDELVLPPFYAWVGPVPLVVIPWVELHSGLSGTVTAGLTTNTRPDVDIHVDLAYQGLAWVPTSEVGEVSAEFDVPEVREGARGDATVWVGPRVYVSFYQLLFSGFYTDLRGVVRAEVDCESDPWWTLSAGTETGAGLFAGGAFGGTLAEYGMPLASDMEVLAEADGALCEPTEPAPWSRTYNVPSSGERALSVIATADGGSLVVGYLGGYDNALWVVKLDQLGQISWQRGFEDLGDGCDAVLHPEGGYIVLTKDGAWTFYLLHLDENGDLVWGNRYERTALSTPSMSYRCLAAYENSIFVGGAYDDDVWVAAFDTAGGLQWSVALDSATDPRGSGSVSALVPTSDGSVVAAGTAFNSFCESCSSGEDYWVVKLSSQGVPLWQNMYDSGSGNEDLYGLAADGTGGFLLAGKETALRSFARVARLDSEGNLTRSVRYYIDSSGSPSLYFVCGTPDGGFIAGGEVGGGTSSHDPWVLRLTSDLEVVWMTKYGGTEDEELTSNYGRSLAVYDDGSFLLLARSGDYYDDPTAVWLQRMSQAGSITYDEGISLVRTNLTGTHEDEHDILQEATDAVTRDIELTVTQVAPEDWTPLTTDAVVETQATP